MAFLGKEYKFVKDENWDTFLKLVSGAKDEDIQRFVSYNPTVKLVKDGDTYTFIFTHPSKTKEVKFKSGVEQEEEILPGMKVKVTYTVEGNVVTQLIKKDGETATFKREYDGDDLKVTITASHWDGVSHRYYKA